MQGVGVPKILLFIALISEVLSNVAKTNVGVDPKT